MPKTNKAKRRPDHTKMSAEERIRNFRLIDDMFFGAVMNNDIELTEKILEIVLGKKIHIVSAIAESTEIDLRGKSIRSDLKAIDDKGNRYLFEAQKRKKGMNPKRMSYSLIKISDGIMEKGSDDWDKMKHRYVIMFCETDYFGNGQPITYGDTVFAGEKRDMGTTIVYVNGQYRGDDEIGRLMHDFMCSNPDSIYDEQIREKVRQVKKGREIRRMCEVVNTAVRKAVAQERQKAGRINAQNRKVIKAKDTEIEQLKKENDHLMKIIITAGISI
ncbi:MAG: hypothetical protein E7190_12360 [Erysipelotrichaceae bacterium]|nr:hypothetical protein [Erysipelotrichaceae bacterium]